MVRAGEGPATSVPVWRDPPALVLDTDMAQLADDKTRVVFVVRVSTPGAQDFDYGKALVRQSNTCKVCTRCAVV